jgi:hypothetical protein
MNDEYERDLASITRSGPHEILEAQQALNRLVHEELADIMPISDIHKISDADLIYRFLIAQRWHTQKAADALRDYAEWRATNNLNGILWETFPPEAVAMMPKFHGTDRFGSPIFYDRPSPTVVGQLLATVPREVLVRAHLAMMEQGRRLCKAMNVDRVSSILDLSLLSMSIVTNPSAVGLLKQFSHMDQTYYPENMRTMLLQNAGWTFSSLYRVIRPLLDVRVQKKIQIMRTGSDLAEDMSTWVDLEQVPLDYGGNGAFSDPHPALDVASLPVGSPYFPLVPRTHEDISTFASCLASEVDENELRDRERDEPFAGDDRDAAASSNTVVFTPPVKPAVPRKITEFYSHRSINPAGVETSTAFALGWPVVQLCGSAVVNASGAIVADVVRASGGRLCVRDAERKLRYVVAVPRLAAVRNVKVIVSRPTAPDMMLLDAANADAAIKDVYRSLDVTPSNPFDLRDWTCFSHTRRENAIMVRNANHVTFQKELLSVPLPVLFALTAAICRAWPWPTAV